MQLPESQTDAQGRSLFIAGDEFIVDESAMGLLGQGGQGSVRIAQRKATGEFVAVKLANGTKAGTRELRVEVDALSMVNHPGIVRLHAYALASGSDACIALELCEGGELFDEVIAAAEARLHGDTGQAWQPNSGGLSYEIVRDYLIQLSDALVHCHERGVAHRDIKAENILLDGRGCVKIVDFGLAVVGAGACVGEREDAMASLARTQCGSLMYAAPELLAGAEDLDAEAKHHGAHHAVDLYSAPKVDVWSLGVVLYSMLTGAMPFQCANKHMCERYAAYLVHGTAIFPYMPAGARHLLSRMLEPDPRYRADMREVASHSWLASSSHPELTLNVGRAVASARRPSVTTLTKPLEGLFRGSVDTPPTSPMAIRRMLPAKASASSARKSLLSTPPASPLARKRALPAAGEPATTNKRASGLRVTSTSSQHKSSASDADPLLFEGVSSSPMAAAGWVSRMC